jgi:DNA-binding NarL/FixJ family response regulator
MIKVLIADDQNLLANSLKSIIEQDQEIIVVGCAGDGMEALKLCDSLSPDIVLMDIKMPRCDGVNGTKLIKSKYGQIKVLILTMLEDEQNISQALENGADGYVLKDVTPDELIQAIKNVYQGFGIISNKVFQVVRSQLTANKEAAPSLLQGTGLNLSDDETKLIRLIAEGKSNKQIAAEIFLSEGRVKNIITELLGKLNVRNRYELLSLAYKNNLIH